jgi:hypothetical protein
MPSPECVRSKTEMFRLDARAGESRQHVHETAE